MDEFRVSLSRPHAYPVDEARTRLERLITAIGARFPGYQLKHAWDDDHKLSCTFNFEKPGKGAGAGKARLRDAAVELELEARYNLPFFVPRFAAEKLLKDEVKKALDDNFGP